MKHRERLTGKSGKGSYTAWKKGKINLCIYCGREATTREHIPSKTFLRFPYPENLPTIPACYECNNGFSHDEKYISYYLMKLKSLVYTSDDLQSYVNQKLEKDNKLKELLDMEIRVENNVIHYEINEDKLIKILDKLALGHAGYELDFVGLNDVKYQVSYDFIFNLNSEYKFDFEGIILDDISPEIESRGVFIVQSPIEFYGKTAYVWQNIQEDSYRYQVSIGKKEFIVKIVILEFLFAKVTLIINKEGEKENAK